MQTTHPSYFTTSILRRFSSCCNPDSPKLLHCLYHCVEFNQAHSCRLFTANIDQLRAGRHDHTSTEGSASPRECTTQWRRSTEGSRGCHGERRFHATRTELFSLHTGYIAQRTRYFGLVHTTMLTTTPPHQYNTVAHASQDVRAEPLEALLITHLSQD
eukprot:COSAG02_NODE_590_length_19879_cov_4.877755_3_plen_158_part_00